MLLLIFLLLLLLIVLILLFPIILLMLGRVMWRRLQMFVRWGIVLFLFILLPLLLLLLFIQNQWNISWFLLLLYMFRIVIYLFHSLCLLYCLFIDYLLYPIFNVWLALLLLCLNLVLLSNIRDLLLQCLQIILQFVFIHQSGLIIQFQLPQPLQFLPYFLPLLHCQLILTRSQILPQPVLLLHMFLLLFSYRLYLFLELSLSPEWFLHAFLYSVNFLLTL